MKFVPKHSFAIRSQQIFAALIVTGILSVSCGVTQTKSSVATDKSVLPAIAQNLKQNATANSLPRQVADAVLQRSSEVPGLPTRSLNILTFKRTQWARGCEQPTFPYPCDPVLETGWEVTVGAGNNLWTYVVDDLGSIIKQSEQGISVNLPQAIAHAVLEDAFEWSGSNGISRDSLRIVKAQQKSWGNSCIFAFGRECNAVSLPVSGWEVTVDSGTQQWIYHVDDRATSVVVDRTLSLMPRAAEVIKKDAAKYSYSPIRIIAVERRNDWNGSCEGVARCTHPLAPGWQATLSDGRNSYIYWVKEDGSEFEFQALASLPQSIVDQVLAHAARQTKARVALSLNNIVNAERVVWSDACLGVAGACVATEVPGWRITVASQNHRLIYHTDSSSVIKFNDIESQMDDTNATVEPVPIPASQLPPRLEQNMVFRQIASGGFAGRGFETVLLNDGRLLHTRMGDANDSERKILRVSRQQVRQFQQLLKRQQFVQFVNLNYLAAGGVNLCDTVLATVVGFSRKLCCNRPGGR